MSAFELNKFTFRKGNLELYIILKSQFEISDAVEGVRKIQKNLGAAIRPSKDLMNENIKYNYLREKIRNERKEKR